ncbi:MAG: heavy metal translocating P-type ATPase [Burkholderiaceae bacterium]
MHESHSSDAACCTGAAPTKPAAAEHDPHGGDRHGHAHQQTAAPVSSHAGSPCCSGPASLPAPHRRGAAAQRGNRYHISRMDCQVEEAEIRHALGGIAGIEGLHFDLGRRQLSLQAPAAVEAQAIAAIRRLGFDPQPVAAGEGTGTAHAHPDHGHPHEHAPPPRSALPRLVAALLLAGAAEGLAYLAPATLPWRAAGMALAAAAIMLAGFSTYAKGLAALRALRLNINALMAVAVSGAFLIGQWPEAAMVMALYAIAELIEARAFGRTRGAIQSLLALAPEQAEVQQPGGGWLRVAAASVAVGAVVRLRPGERVPLDGTVTSGQGAVDQAAVTGESLPVDKAPGDPLYAGTLNQGSALEYRVGAPASDSSLARIIHAVEQAQAARAPTQALVDRFAAVYTPAVFALSLAVALLAPPLLGWTWLDAVYKALVLLVIACPCALVISTPVTLVSGLTAAARRGILIKGGAYLEQARRLKVVALDKTGTLTAGRPRLVDSTPLDAGADLPRLQRIARSLAARSDHPVSRALAEGLDGEPLEVQDFVALPGLGVQGRVDGQLYRLGKPGWIALPAAQLGGHEAAGHTLSVLAQGETARAVFAVADTIKPGAAAAVAELKALGIRPVMLSGDNAATARAIAAQAGITEAYGDLLPADKLDRIAALRAQHGPTAMVGDGINDAPALARADIGFAIRGLGGIGSDTAMEAADVVLMNEELGRLAETVRLSQRARAVLLQNLALALGIKLAFLAAALAGQASMWMAVFADMGCSLLVVANGLRLARGGKA